MNDLGFSGRDNFRNFYAQAIHRGGELESASRFLSHRYYADLQHYLDDDGRHLYSAASVTRESQLRGGGTLSLGWRAENNEIDDRFLRGFGDLRIDDRHVLSATFDRPRTGAAKFGHGLELELRNGTLDGLVYTLTPSLNYAVSDALNVDAALAYTHYDDWLLWQGGRELAGFDTNWLDFSANLNWIVSERRELRVKLQSIGIVAHEPRALITDADGTARASGSEIPDFSLQNLGFQVRYRQELIPGADLYLVYSRGGGALEQGERGLTDVFGDSFALRDADQFLVKLSWQFDR